MLDDLSPCSYCGKMLRKRGLGSHIWGVHGDGKGKCGGLRKGAGRGRRGWYNGIWCDSSWELAWVIYNLDHDTNFQRNYDYFEYRYLERISKYYPDFRLADGTYIEIKGFMQPRDEAKFKQFPHPIKIVGQREILPLLEYVRRNYGENFSSLYFGEKSRWTCSVCGIMVKPRRKYCSKCRGRNISKTIMEKHLSDTEERDRGILKMYGDGCSHIDIARETGLSSRGIAKILKRRGIQEVRRAPNNIFEQNKDGIREWVKRGKTNREICEILGASKKSFGHWRRREGLQLRENTPEKLSLDELRRLRTEGWTYQKIGARFGVCKGTVHKKAKRHGIS